jgi:hypothetical protein
MILIFPASVRWPTVSPLVPGVDSELSESVVVVDGVAGGDLAQRAALDEPLDRGSARTHRGARPTITA